MCRFGVRANGFPNQRETWVAVASQAIGPLARTGIGRQNAGEALDEGRLAAAIRAEKSEPRAGTEHEVHVVEHAPIPEALGDVFRDHQPLGPAIGGVEVDAGGAAARRRRTATTSTAM